jgi:hypothetical protein
MATLHSPSRPSKNADLLFQALLNKESVNEHVDTVEQLSHSPLNSAAFNKRQTEFQSMSTLSSLPSQTRNANLSARGLHNEKSGSEHVSAVEQQSYKSSGSASFNRRQSESEFMIPGSSGRIKNTSMSAQAIQSNKSGNKQFDVVEQQSDIPSRSVPFRKRQFDLNSIDVVHGSSNPSGRKEGKKVQNSANRRENSSNRSMRAQNVPWFRQWQEKVAATRKTCAFDLLPKEERIAKLREFVAEMKQKHDEKLKIDLMRSPFVSRPGKAENLKVIQSVNKRKVSCKPLHPDFLVNGKAYRPRLRRPKSWATPRLYKLIIPKCEEKYGTIKARRKAQEFVIFLCEKVCNM